MPRAPQELDASNLSRVRLIHADFAHPPARLARLLLGALLVRVLPDGSRLSGLIVETEAYLGVRDRAAHSFGARRTPRNEAMYAPAGTAYVYFTYGMHHCFNVVCGKPDEPVAVLVRALQPVEGINAMRKARATTEPRALCSGPAKLCQALSLARPQNALDLAASQDLWIEWGLAPLPSARIARGTRIGIASAGVWASKPLRWAVLANPHVSVPLPRTPRSTRLRESATPKAIGPTTSGTPRAKSTKQTRADRSTRARRPRGTRPGLV